MRNPIENKARAILGSGRGKRPRIEAAAGEATLFIYDYIGWLGVEAAPVVRELAALNVQTIHVRINSPGGDVFDGLAIYNALKQHSARVIVHVDSLAASIASVIAMAGDEIHMAEGAFIMIHNPWTLAIGDAAELRKVAEVLDQVGGSLAGIYAGRSGQSREDVEAMMDEETWMNAEQAVERGFADSVDGREVEAAASFDLSIFNHVPEDLAAKTGPKKSERKIETVRDLETFLREEGGFSHAAARNITASCFKQPPEPRDEDGGLADLVAAAERRGAVFTTL